MKLWPGVIIRQYPEKTVWHPVMYWAGKRRFVASEHTESGFVECDTQKAALKYAKDYIAELEAKRVNDLGAVLAGVLYTAMVVVAVKNIG